ncbi:hypothetical protein M2169_000931 [Streptomyces sp. MJP52]|nr:hypothetical protein [Streptomyces sp. MJP52]
MQGLHRPAAVDCGGEFGRGGPVGVEAGDGVDDLAALASAGGPAAVGADGRAGLVARGRPIDLDHGDVVGVLGLGRPGDVRMDRAHCAERRRRRGFRPGPVARTGAGSAWSRSSSRRPLPERGPRPGGSDRGEQMPAEPDGRAGSFDDLPLTATSTRPAVVREGERRHPSGRHRTSTAVTAASGARSARSAIPATRPVSRSPASPTRRGGEDATAGTGHLVIVELRHPHDHEARACPAMTSIGPVRNNRATPEPDHAWPQSSTFWG